MKNTNALLTILAIVVLVSIVIVTNNTIEKKQRMQNWTQTTDERLSNIETAVTIDHMYDNAQAERINALANKQSNTEKKVSEMQNTKSAYVYEPTAACSVSQTPETIKLSCIKYP